ncbi:MAG: GPR endopeptidase [Bacillota bacterium]|jgi:spore protease
MLSDYKKTENLDLAMEAKESLQGNANIEIQGVRETIRRTSHAKITEIEILNEQGAEQMKRSIGKYITMEIPELNSYNEADLAEEIIAAAVEVLRGLYKIQKDKPTLIIGLGNVFTTPDSLGPTVISHIQPTAHVYEKFDLKTQNETSPICLLNPGVLGNTGIATFDTIESVVNKIQPAALIVIDALATASITRICNTIQITDTGIRPGSGIARNNKEINPDNMNIPVIAIGIPTIMHAGTIINEAIEYCLNSPRLYFNAQDENVIVNTVEDLLKPYSGDLMVTPKEINTMIPVCAKILATAIVRTVHPGLSDKNYRDFMQ